jgi:hypothetical protein
MTSIITFDVNSFCNDRIFLLKFLRSLKHKGLFVRTKELDVFCSKQPSLAYKYIKNIVVEKQWNSCGLNPGNPGKWIYFNVDKNRLDIEEEKVFLKNIKFAIAYLEITQQKKFRDEKLNKKIEKKIYKNAGSSFDYAKNVLFERIPENKENIFIENYYWMYQYSMQVIKGKFPEKIHNQICLKSFEKFDSTQRLDCLQAYLKQDPHLTCKHRYFRY